MRDRLAAAFGVSSTGREDVVRAMLEGHVRQAPLYWLQLTLALGIATLGLVLNSTVVLIGAMLIAPLMGPIVGLAMGLAIGSPLLVLRSLVRVLGSIVVVVGASALITLALPFQEVTSEIAARTSPTVLDLLVAMGCALTAALTTMRPGSDTVSTAAGTSIGISLVPPLCVVGFGLGTSQGHLSSGAALLFVANLCSILLLTSAAFVLFGFDRVDLGLLERDQPSSHRPIHRAAASLRSVFGSKHGPLLRLLMPVVLVASVYMPLRQALSEVSWEVTTRARLHRLLGEMPLARGAVRSQLSVERHEVHLRLIVVASAAEATELQRTLELRASALAGVAPSVEVLAVPDVIALQQATRDRDAGVPPPAPAAPDTDTLGRSLGAALARSWPVAAAGPLVSWRLDLGAGDRPVVELLHVGAPVGSAAEPLLASALGADLGRPVAVRDVALAAGSSAAPGEGTAWLPSLARALDTARQLALHACVSWPATVAARAHAPRPDARLAAEVAALSAVEAELRRAGDRASGRDGETWSVRVQREACVAPGPVGSASASAAPSGAASAPPVRP